MTAAQSAALAATSVFWPADPSRPTEQFARFIYDLEIVSAGGVVTRELEGRVMLQREVTA